jgi:HSP20 family protein
MARGNLPQIRFGDMFDDLGTDVERMLKQYFGSLGQVARREPLFAPSIDVSESENGYEVKVDLPGVKPADVHVEINEGQLTIRGHRAEEKKEENKNYHRVERFSGEFLRTVTLPDTVDRDRIDAHYEDGVLHVTLPKTLAKQPKKIEIRQPKTS